MYIHTLAVLELTKCYLLLCVSCKSGHQAIFGDPSFISFVSAFMI